MRKRKESHDSPPVVDTNILFVPSSAEDPSSLGVDDLMGMINGAGTTTAPAQKPDIPGPEDKTEILDPIVVPESVIVSPVVTVNALQSPAPPPPASAIIDAPPPPLPDDEEAATPRGPILPPPLPDDEEAARPSGPVLPPPAPEAGSGVRMVTEPPTPEPPAPEQTGPSAATNEASKTIATSVDQTDIAASPGPPTSPTTSSPSSAGARTSSTSSSRSSQSSSSGPSAPSPAPRRAASPWTSCNSSSSARS